jgi:hypothetical protein
VLPVDWDHFHVLLTGLLHRVPSMSSAILERLTNGPEAFSPDGEWILGQAPEVRIVKILTLLKLRYFQLKHCSNLIIFNYLYD